MTISLLSAFLSILSPSAFSATPQLSCQAIYRTLDEKNNTIEKSISLTARALAGDVKHEADFEGKFFTLTEEKNGDLFAQITTAPDYTRGLVVRGAADSKGRFTATEVVGFTIYRLECARNQN